MNKTPTHFRVLPKFQTPSGGTITTERWLTQIRDAAHSKRNQKSGKKIRLLDKNENSEICQNPTSMIRPGPFNVLPTERKHRKLGCRFSGNLYTRKRKKTLGQKHKFWNLSKSNVQPIQSALDWEKEPKIGSSMVPSGGLAATSRQSAPSPLAPIWIWVQLLLRGFCHFAPRKQFSVRDHQEVGLPPLECHWEYSVMYWRSL